jgi:hypothetical protein
VVLRRGGAGAAVLVQWESGRQEKVKPRDPAVKYALDGSRRLEWLLEPSLLHEQFRTDPTSVFVDVIRDEGKSIQTAQIKRRLVECGLNSDEVASAFNGAKTSLRANRHIVIKGGSHLWSDVPVDPYVSLRKLPPHEALDQLLTTPRLKPDQKQALADAIRAGLPPR